LVYIFINALTGWFAGYSNTYHKGFVAKTNDGGSYWTEYNPVNKDLKSVYFYNNLTGWAVGDSGMVLKSTDGGVVWGSQQVSFDYFLKVKFYDANTGWILSENKVFKTTNGGSYWSSIYTNTIISFKSFTFMDLNTGWIVGYKTSPQNEGVILKTSNGGINWIEQLPYTNNFLNAIHFINLNTGWAVGNNGTILKTITGGVITNIHKINPNVTSFYSLSQNYPNPFNPNTKIKFDIPKSSNIKLTVYDITGKEISILADEKISPGSYEVEFNGNKSASGIYFYRLETSDFIQTNKMILLK